MMRDIGFAERFQIQLTFRARDERHDSGHFMPIDGSLEKVRQFGATGF